MESKFTNPSKIYIFVHNKDKAPVFAFITRFGLYKSNKSFSHCTQHYLFKKTIIHKLIWSQIRLTMWKNLIIHVKYIIYKIMIKLLSAPKKMYILGMYTETIIPH